MTAEDRIKSLLLLWQEQQAHGHDLTATELCRDCPELEPALREQIGILRHVKALLQEPGASAAVTVALRAHLAQASLPEAAPASSLTLEHQTADSGQTRKSRGAEEMPLPAAQVPGYEVVKELGRGGMGVVYLARQTRLGRLVALKMILAGDHARAEDLKRFRTEAEAVARLQHPNIVQVFEVGEHEGRPFFSLEFCPGGSLDKKLAGSPLPPEEAARLIQMLAGAVQAAHEANVIHRDLKPSNVLLAADGTAKVSDFGLAKKLDEAGQTHTGAVMGTPSYMSPEQAEGKKAVGPAADVYALGAILYECLTGRPPFKAASLYDTLLQVQTQEPVPARQLNVRVPVDLETISRKCLEKDPARRYASARDLAEDVKRFLAGEPILARPVGWLERTLRWVKRRPAMAVLSAGCVLAGLALLGLGFWFSAEMGAAGVALKAEANRRNDAEQLAQTYEFFGMLRGIEKRSAQPSPGWTWANLDDLPKAAALTLAGQHLLELRSEAANALGQIDIRRRAVVGQGFDAACLSYHPDGRWLALGQFKATAWAVLSVSLIDPRTGQATETLTAPANALASLAEGAQDGIYALAFSPDGRWLVAGTRFGTMHRWDLKQKPAALVSWPGHKKSVTNLLFSLDGTALYSASDRENVVQRWAVSAWEKPAREQKAERSPAVGCNIVSLAWHPTEGWLGCTSQDHSLAFLSGDTLQPIRPPLRGLGGRLQFLPDGNSLVFERPGQLNFLNLRNQQVLRSLGLPGGDADRLGVVTDLAISPDGVLVASAVKETRHVYLWEVASGRLLADLVAGGGSGKLAFSPDGRTLAVTADQQTLLYEIGGLRQQTFAAGSPEQILTCALHPDGHSLACLAISLWRNDHRDVTVWQANEGRPAPPLARHTFWNIPDGERSVSFHPRSQTLAYTAHGKILVQDSAGRLEPRSIPDVKEASLCFSPDGRLWAAVADEVRVWDEAGRQLPGWSNRLGEIFTGKSSIYAVCAGRQWSAAGGRDGQVHLFAAADARRLAGAMASQAPVRAVALNGDETLLAVGADNGDLCLLRVPDGQVLSRLSSRGRGVGGDLFLPSSPKRGRGVELLPPLAPRGRGVGAEGEAPHSDRVAAVSWSGGRLLASGSRDRTVKLWKCAGGRLQELLTLRQPAPVRWLAFHPDGVRLFVLLDEERAVRVWHLDRLFARLTKMALGTDLEPIQARPLPAPAATPRPSEPVLAKPLGPNGLKAELFADMELHRCIKVRQDAQVNWNWGTGSPDPLLPVDHFSIRWTGWLKAPRPGRYTLQLVSDDGARLWLDGKCLLNRWQPSPGTHQVEVELSGQPQELRIEYFEFDREALIHFNWAQAGGFALQPVPTEALFHDRPR